MAIEAQNTTDAGNPTTADTSIGSWVAGVAADAWHGGVGAARVAGQFGLGIAEEAYEHPGRTALQVGGGILAAGAAAEAGVTAAGAAAIAAVPLAGYGLYRGAVIASTEGVGAIPAHVGQSYDEARAALSSAGDAIANVYHGGSSTGVENIGRAAAPFVAGAIGGGGSELGQMAIRGGARAMGALAESTLPSLTLEPALVSGVLPETARAGARTIAAAEAAAAGTTAASAGARILHRDGDDSAGGASAGNSDSSGANALDTARRHNLFVEGRQSVGGAASTAESGEQSLSASFRNIFDNADRILKNGGREGNVELESAGDMVTAHIVAGDRAGAYAIYSKSQGTFIVEASKTSAVATAPLR